MLDFLGTRRVNWPRPSKRMIYALLVENGRLLESGEAVVPIFSPLTQVLISWAKEPLLLSEMSPRAEFVEGEDFRS